MKLNENNIPEEFLPLWIRPSLVIRARKRKVVPIKDGKYSVLGESSLGDCFSDYTVWQEPIAKRWCCSCQSHSNGVFRGQCSHIVSAIIFEQNPTWETGGDSSLSVFVAPEPNQGTRNSPESTGCLDLIASMFEAPHGSWSGGEGEAIAEEPKESKAAPQGPREAAPALTEGDTAKPPPATSGNMVLKNKFNSIEELESFLNNYLPPWCPSIRKQQLEAIYSCIGAVESGVKTLIVEAPTGMGKSLFGYLMAIALGARANYICTDKDLQDQFSRDFKPVGAEVLKGMANYPTADYASEFPEINCGSCDYKKSRGCTYCEPTISQETGEPDPWTSKQRCPYRIQKAKTQKANLSILNTSYFMLVARNEFASGVDNVSGFLGYNNCLSQSYGFANRGLTIFDECHKLDGVLREFVGVEISEKMLDFFKSVPPRVTSRWKKRVEFLKELLAKVSKYLRPEESQKKPKTELEEDEGWKKRVSEFEDKLVLLIHELAVLEESEEPEDSHPWIYEVAEDCSKCSFRPVLVGKYANKVLFRHSAINLLMSGTIPNPRLFCSELGIDWSQCYFLSLGSTFKKERRMVLFKPVADMSFKSQKESMPRMAKAICEIHNRFEGNTLVHTVSYELNSFLFDFLRRNKIPVITYSNSSQKREALERLSRSKNSIILAASMAEGVDLKGDLCRKIIIPKVPFGSLADRLTKRRLWLPTKAEGNEWYKTKTLETIIQMVGRGCRNQEDWCATFILDQNFDRLWKEMRSYIPKWFSESVTYIENSKIFSKGLHEH